MIGGRRQRTALTRAIATFGHVGLLPGPAGTWGSLAALPAGYALHGLGGFPLLAAATIAVACLGWWAIHVEIYEQDDLDPWRTSSSTRSSASGSRSGRSPSACGTSARPPRSSPGRAGSGPSCSSGSSTSGSPGPVSWADRRKGPTGVMLDDVLAGIIAAVVVMVLAAIAHGWLMA